MKSDVTCVRCGIVHGKRVVKTLIHSYKTTYYIPHTTISRCGNCTLYVNSKHNDASLVRERFIYYNRPSILSKPKAY